jgi:hypothetical protein
MKSKNIVYLFLLLLFNCTGPDIAIDTVIVKPDSTINMEPSSIRLIEDSIKLSGNNHALKKSGELLDSMDLYSISHKLVIFESRKFVIIADRNQAREFLTAQIIRYGMKEDRELLRAIVKDSSEVKLDKIHNKQSFKVRLIFLTAGLLTNGNCLVYNKELQRLERKIEIIEYEDIGCSGRRFIAGKKLVLETVDRVI